MLLSALALLAAQAADPAARQAAATDRMKQCLEQAQGAPEAAITLANEWLAKASGPARADPLQCLGQAFAGLQRWRAAHDSFIAARDAATPGDYAARARLGAMAGNAALAGNDLATAAADLDKAGGDAALAGDHPLAGSIEADRSRALVALGQTDEAAGALAQARSQAPQDAEVWLLSATLSRRTGDLATAQAQIETAGRLDQSDPAIGLEAGVIAELAGDEAAARKSWQSVIALTPEAPEATSARNYLAQTGGSGG